MHLSIQTVRSKNHVNSTPENGVDINFVVSSQGWYLIREFTRHYDCYTLGLTHCCVFYQTKYLEE